MRSIGLNSIVGVLVQQRVYTDCLDEVQKYLERCMLAVGG